METVFVSKVFCKHPPKKRKNERKIITHVNSICCLVEAGQTTSSHRNMFESEDGSRLTHPGLPCCLLPWCQQMQGQLEMSS